MKPAEVPVLAKIESTSDGDLISFEETNETSFTDEMTIGDLLTFLTQYIEMQNLPHAFIKWVLHNSKDKEKANRYPVAHVFQDPDRLFFQVRYGSKIVAATEVSKEASVKTALLPLWVLLEKHSHAGLYIALPIISQLEKAS